ncbi:MAG: glycosyl hydrolase 115 family protein [Planctomycetota bacterium]
MNTAATGLIADAADPDAFPLVDARGARPVYADPADAPVVHEALELLATDIRACCGTDVAVLQDPPPRADGLLIAGTLAGSPTVRRLREAGRLPDLDALAGGWERFCIRLVDQPLPGVDRGLVVVGSDPRGCAYGILEISRQLGVSPWCWWADVPHPRHESIHLRGMDTPSPEPAVRYRGIFINDEHFRLVPWAHRQIDAACGDVGPGTYRLVFQLMLRLRANYLWPAICTSSFAAQPENGQLARRFAIVLGGHHASSLLRSKHEWWRLHGRDDQTFSYQTNADGVRAFWRSRVRDTRNMEAIYPIGMRGLGDIPAEITGDLAERRDLIARVIADQRELLTEETGRPAERIPQVFTVWKENAALITAGLDLPADVLLLRSNDSYGWLLPLGGLPERSRPGGLGIYHHLSYLGRPNEYLQLCPMGPAQIWHQLHAAAAFGYDRLWVFNVGDIKPAETALSYGMDLAWYGSTAAAVDPASWLPAFFGTVFGPEHGAAAADLHLGYLRLSAQRRPEDMGWCRLEPYRPAGDGRFSLDHADECEERIAAYQRLEERLRDFAARLPASHQDACFQLLGFPIGYAAHLNHKHLHAQRQRWLARMGCAPAAAGAAAASRAAFQRLDGELYPRYQRLAGGKWRHFMDIHKVDSNYGEPQLEAVAATRADAVLVVQGCPPARDGLAAPALPGLHPCTRRRGFMDLYPTTAACSWSAGASDDWIRCEPGAGTVQERQRIAVDIDWDRLPADGAVGWIDLRCGTACWRVAVRAEGAARWRAVAGPCFVEEAGRVSIQAVHFQRHRPRHGVSWTVLRGLGHGGAVVTPLPVTAQPRLPDWSFGDLHDSACLEYDVHLAAGGWLCVQVAALPTHPLTPERGAAYAVGFDDQPPARVDIRTHDQDECWQENVQRGISITRSMHRLESGGHHVLKLWMCDTNIAIDGILIDCGGGWPTYCQPPETIVSVKIAGAAGAGGSRRGSPAR